MHTGFMGRIIHAADAISWLKDHQVVEGTSLLASLPDISEFPGYSLSEWKSWFEDTAALVLSKTPPEGVTLFYQSDIRHSGEWVDKGYLVQRAAEKLGHRLLWHKVVCRAPIGTATFGRPGYTHLLCFSQALVLDQAKSTPDVLPEMGEKTWVRGMGLEVCLELARFIKTQTATHTLIHPFCGEGLMLAAAELQGLNGVGIEKSRKRAERAQKLKLTSVGKSYQIEVE